MKVILIQNVPGLGRVEEIKEVADGYAANYLFPRHLAVPASVKVVGELSAKQKKRAKEAESDLKGQQNLAAKIDGYEIEIHEKTNDKGVLYAAVGSDRIARELGKKGFSVDKDQILSKPFKQVGTFPVKLKFRHGLESNITITISN